MKISHEELAQKLAGTCNSPEMDNALAACAVELAKSFEGNPNDFVNKVKEKVKADHSEHKFNPDGGYSNASKALREYISPGEDPPAGDSKDSVSNPSPGSDETQKSDPPPEGKKESPKTTTSNEVTVMLSPKISSYGGRLYDFETGACIKGKNPTKVKASIQIRRWINTGQLIEVK
jgi:hypothetical protein